MSIKPNFWLSEEYLQAQDVTVRDNGELIWIEEGEWTLFPPLLSPLAPPDRYVVWPPMKIWSDFPNFSIGRKMEFLDWEYTYHPSAFKEMKGGEWSTFRKNSRKWPRRNPLWTHSQAPESRERAEDLLMRWLEGRPQERIQDQEALWHFIFSADTQSFVRREGELVGMNVWDASWYHEGSPYIMYRYCITDPHEPFLDEFTRLLFYREICRDRDIVIDGGVLDNPGLERFKDKMNPALKRPVYSRIVE